MQSALDTEQGKLALPGSFHSGEELGQVLGLEGFAWDGARRQWAWLALHFVFLPPPVLNSGSGQG